MIIEFLISTIIVGVLGVTLIFTCKSSKKKLEEELKTKIDKLEKTYSEERILHNEEITKLRQNLEDIKKEYSSKAGKSKSILY